MAKVTDLKFDVKGVEYKIGVNCTSSGQFNANLPDTVAAALRINKKITAPTLQELQLKFKDHLDKYKNAETTEELFILIAYHARGFFSKRKDGSYMFNGHRHKYELSVSFDRPKNAIGLDFFVAIKETVDGSVKWFKGKLGRDYTSWMEEDKQALPDTYHRDGDVWRADEYKKIPFTEKALDSLKNAREKLRAASEMLFDFIEQDEEQIALALNSQKLLS